jgi:multicomponent Na+:H+ antiporter subunit D
MINNIPPFLVFFIAAAFIPFLRGRLLQLLLILVPFASAWSLIGIEHGVYWQLSLFSYTLEPYRVDRLSLLFGYLFHIAALISIIYALNVRDKIQHVSSLLYIGSALGAVFSGDLISLFVFWELMAVTSVFLIWARRTRRAIESGFRYLIIQMGSGMLFLAGAVLHVYNTGSLQFDFIGLGDLSSLFIFTAFGIKCAFPLLHNWLTDSYPEATPSGTVFLSAFTTKVAVYSLARGFPGTELLIYIGAVMTCFPIFYAVIENDLRRVLGYSMINQLGFMVCGIGIGTALSINGAVAHAFTDVLFKGLLFMSMGAVLHMTGRINGSDLGGLYKSMPKTTVLCIVGAASISAFPLFSGFVSKSMVMVAALEEGHHGVWLALLFASAGVFHHAGIKIPFFAFFAHDSGIRVTDPPVNMLFAMLLAAVLCIFIGSYPWVLYSFLPQVVDYIPFDTTHVIAQLQLLFFSALAFTWLKLSGLYPPELHSVNIDVEWIYRRFFPRFWSVIILFTGRMAALGEKVVRTAYSFISSGLLRVYGMQGIASRTVQTDVVIILVLVFLTGYLLFYLINS